MSSYIQAALRKQVRDRARNCCEYCLLHEDNAFFSHEIDHIISEKHRGETTLDNLCMSCFECNRFKGSDIGSLDIDTDTFTRLYNPRKDSWDEHFTLKNAKIIPLTAIGRITVFLLQMNTEEQITKRKALLKNKLYPCSSPDD